jgi:hypothetical protein
MNTIATSTLIFIFENIGRNMFGTLPARGLAFKAQKLDIDVCRMHITWHEQRNIKPSIFFPKN